MQTRGYTQNKVDEHFQIDNTKYNKHFLNGEIKQIVAGIVRNFAIQTKNSCW